MTLIIKAAQFAARAHAGQFRRVTGRPYIEHPARVAALVAIRQDHSSEWDHEVCVAAAFLHDVVEDCGVTYEQLDEEFGSRAVTAIVRALTKPPLSAGKRAERQAMFLTQLKCAGRDVQTIKLIDRLDNLREIDGDKEDFIRLYCKETRELVCAIGEAAVDVSTEIIKLVQVLESKVK